MKAIGHSIGLTIRNEQRGLKPEGPVHPSVPVTWQAQFLLSLKVWINGIDPPDQIV